MKRLAVGAAALALLAGGITAAVVLPGGGPGPVGLGPTDSSGVAVGCHEMNGDRGPCNKEWNCQYRDIVWTLSTTTTTADGLLQSPTVTQPRCDVQGQPRKDYNRPVGCPPSQYTPGDDQPYIAGCEPWGALAAVSVTGTAPVVTEGQTTAVSTAPTTSAGSTVTVIEPAPSFPQCAAVKGALNGHFWPPLTASSYYKTWAKRSPEDARKVGIYRADPTTSPPTLSTKFGLALVGAIQMYVRACGL